MDAAARAFLETTRSGDGGWGYGPEQASTIEATAAVALAAHGEPADAGVRRAALAWLAAAQHEDGGWGMSRDDAESAWPTAWAVLALSAGGADHQEAVGHGASWLAAVNVLRITEDELGDEFRSKLSVDPNLEGWPWLPGESSWIEPTALAILALTAAGGQQATTRIAEATRFIADRRCQGGGWNFGNPIMLGSHLPPRVHPTAWALLALALAAPALIRPEDLAALRTEMRRDGGALALAWGLLALRTLGQDDADAAGRLTAQRQADGGWNANPFHTAVASLAERGRL